MSGKIVQPIWERIMNYIPSNSRNLIVISIYLLVTLHSAPLMSLLFSLLKPQENNKYPINLWRFHRGSKFLNDTVTCPIHAPLFVLCSEQRGWSYIQSTAFSSYLRRSNHMRNSSQPSQSCGLRFPSSFETCKIRPFHLHNL